MPEKDENIELVLDFCRETEGNLNSLDEHLSRLRPFIFALHFDMQQFVNLYQNLNIPEFQDSLHAINRVVHTVKGITSFLDLPNINRYCHKVEEMTLNISNGYVFLSQAAYEVISKIPVVLNRFLEAVKTTYTDGSVSVDKEVREIEETNQRLLSQMKGQRILLDDLHGKDLGRVRDYNRTLKITIDLDVFDKSVQGFQAFVQESLNMLLSHGVPLDVLHFLRSGLTDHLDQLILMSRNELVLSRYIRIVKDLGSSMGKQVQLRIPRNEAKARPDVWDHCHNALVHLVRNSVDHGIEEPDDREKAGKPPEGAIDLEIFEDFKNIYIYMRDDGGGIDSEKVARIAVDRGIITEDQSRLMTVAEKQNLIFLPGFSTRSDVTDISGRGVGMDAVKKEIESALKGRVAIDSKPGAGTQFRLEIPKMETLSECVVFGVDPHIYAIPMVADIEYLECREEFVRRVFDRMPIYTERGLEMPLLNLFALLHPEKYGGASINRLPIIKMKIDGAFLGIVVPQIRGQERMNIFRSNRINALMGDGGLIFGYALTDPVTPIFDLDRLVSLF